MPALVDLLANLGIIFTLVGIWSLWFDADLRRPAKVGQGPVIALAGSACVVLLISLPIEVIEGAIFDLRAVPIVLTGIFGGPAAGILVGAVAAGYRLAVGGVGAWPGVAGIGLTTLVAVAGPPLLRNPTSIVSLVLLGSAAALSNLLGPLLLPREIRSMVLEQVGVASASVVLLAIVFIGRMIAHDLERRQAIADLRDTEQRLFQANEALSVLASMDALTSISNRRAFDEALAAEIGRSHRNGTPLSLLLLDIDNFKSFNDEHGHPAGDDCLRRIAASIQGELHRSGDLVARFGGEEFSVLLPGTDAEGATAVAERIRTAIGEASGPEPSKSQKTVTASIGVATIAHPQDSEVTAEELMRRADQALYRAKRGGRNMVLLHDASATG